ncbi:MarR family winged helix-turn-helix transcriptional regulator [Sporolactobacillus sp. KGMB 08714]|uniref:MarR family winged helix-turn-helix transcriptional regulator n=1 Tax=Sporolactobacillus sp. KGMB 08714 TaxID=3064704 RepID=UPI002FBEB8C4
MDPSAAKEYVTLISNLFTHYQGLNRGSMKVTHLQGHILEFMYSKQKALNLKEISEGLEIAKQQLTHVVSGLEKKGYLIKRPDERDKRAVLVTLTPAGKAMEEQKWRVLYQKFIKSFNRLTEEEQFDFCFALHKVNTLLQKMGG